MNNSLSIQCNEKANPTTMKPSLQQKLDLYAENVELAKKAFTLHNRMIRQLCTFIYASEGKKLDGDTISTCNKLIKKDAGLLSGFRGSTSLIIAALLSLTDNPKAELTKALDVHSRMKKVKFWNSDYLSLAAYQIATETEPENYDTTIERTRDYFDGMKEKHPMLTDKEDYVMAAMLALSGIPVDTGLQRMENIFDSLKEGIFFNDRMQSLGQVMVLGRESAVAIQRINAIQEASQKRGYKLDHQHTYSILGVLTLLPNTPEETADDIASACQYLREQKGLGAFTLNNRELIMMASALVASSEADELRNNSVDAILGAKVANIILAQETAIIASMAIAAVAESSDTGL